MGVLGFRVHMGGCQNYGPFLDLYYNTVPDGKGTQKGTIILITTRLGVWCVRFGVHVLGFQVV